MLYRSWEYMYEYIWHRCTSDLLSYVPELSYNKSWLNECRLYVMMSEWLVLFVWILNWVKLTFTFWDYLTSSFLPINLLILEKQLLSICFLYKF